MSSHNTAMVVITCLAVPLSLIYYNPSYLLSETGYADGGDMYSHIIEAIHLKERLENGASDFWFDKVSLGFLSPLLVFRLVLVAVLSFIPFAFYKSSTLFRLKPVQGLSLCLLAFGIQSGRQFGMEISAFIGYGLLTQAFGMLLIPLTVSITYNWIFYCNLQVKRSSLAFLILAVTFLTNFFFGLYACILSTTMLFVKLTSIQSEQRLAEMSKVIFKFVYMHMNWLMLISWWFIACLIGYKYIGGLPWRGASEDGYPALYLLNALINGDIFDAGRPIPWLTILVLLGFIINNLKIARLQLYIDSYTNDDRNFSCWLILSTVISTALLLGRTTFSFLYDLIPFHTELETIKYLNAVHFCGLLLASSALTELLTVASKQILHLIMLTSKSSLYLATLKTLGSWHRMLDGAMKISVSCEQRCLNTVELPCKSSAFSTVKWLLIITIAIPLWMNQCTTIGTQLTMTEVNPDFVQRLKEFSNSNSINGRLLGHKALGTGKAWDLAMIPALTNKPGLMTYSRGYHDSLSIFYLESLSFNPEKSQFFAAMLRLYNIHYLMTSSVELDAALAKACQLKHVTTIDDLALFEVLHEDFDYGYFDFVRIVGHVRGDLKQMRETVLKTLELYTVNSVLSINPIATNIHPHSTSTGPIAVNVKMSSWLNGCRYLAENNNVQVTWTWKGKQNDSQVIIDEAVKEQSWKWIYSQVIEEETKETDYYAIVHIAKTPREIEDYEHLLLKVTYHPFWKCFYYPVGNDFALSDFNRPYFHDGKTYVEVRHVTPNLMSVTLPPGRYLVVFTYRFPGILKLLVLICIACGFKTTAGLLQRNSHLSSEGIKQASSEGIKQASSESIKQGSTEGIKQASSESIKQASTEGIKQGSSEGIKQASSESIKQASSDGIKQESSEGIKQASSEGIKQASSENMLFNNTEDSSGERIAFQTNSGIAISDSEDFTNEISKNRLEEDILNSLKQNEVSDTVTMPTAEPWNVKGRLRRHSVAVASKFHQAAVRILLRNSAKNQPIESQSTNNDADDEDFEDYFSDGN
eukprot:gene11056-12223_t